MRILVLSGLFYLFFSQLGIGQEGITSLLQPAELEMEGFTHERKNIRIFDPEQLFSDRGTDRMIPIWADYYSRDGLTQVFVNKKLVAKITNTSFSADHREGRVNCVDNPVTDKIWASGTFAAAVNAAIADERIEFSNFSIADYVHPGYSTSLERSENIIEALRMAYNAGYPGLTELLIESDATMNDVTQDFCCKMDQCNEFNHQSACLGNFVDRIEAGIGTGFCWTFAKENIGATWGYSSVESAVLKTIYNMMYVDLGSNNGHRESFLWCDYTPDTRHGYGEHFTVDNDPYEFLLAWDFVNMTFNSGCTWDTGIGTPTCSALPLELVRFEAKPESPCGPVRLLWEFPEGTTLGFFELQRSIDARHWQRIDRIQGNSSQWNTYEISDGDVPTGTVFYRLKIEDLDGVETYSDLISLNLPCEESLQIVPNPVTDRFRIQAPIAIESVTLWNIQGEKRKKIDVSSGYFSIEEIPAGIYFIELKWHEGTRFLKLLKQ